MGFFSHSTSMSRWLTKRGQDIRMFLLLVGLIEQALLWYESNVS